MTNTNTNMTTTNGIELPVSEIADLEDTIWRALSQMADVTDPDIYDEAKDIRYLIMDCLRTGRSLIDRFEFISSGAYKECYELGGAFSPWVMKLASAANNTVGEKALIEVAESRGLDVFPRTIFISLPVYMLMDPIKEGLNCSDFCTWVDEDEDHTGTWKELSPNSCGNIAGDYIIFQQKCSPMSSLVDYKDAPNLDSYLRKDNYEWDGDALYNSRIESMTWLRKYLEAHSTATLNDLFRFIDDYELSDLRRDNIGIAFNGRPVIMDCLSRA